MDLKKFKITIAAALMATQLSSTADAGVNRDQLHVIQAFIEQNDIDGLLVFLNANPELLIGDSYLSTRLSQFYERMSTVSGRTFPAFFTQNAFSQLARETSRSTSITGIY
jgi:hypothetical protein